MPSLAMNLVDRFLRARDIRRIADYLIPGMKILALGRGQDWLLGRSGFAGPGSLGLDPSLTAEVTTPQGHRRRPWRPDHGVPSDAGMFDAVVAVGPFEDPAGLAVGFSGILRADGLLIVLVDSGASMWIRRVGVGIRRLAGMPSPPPACAERPDRVFFLPRFHLLRHVHCRLWSRELLVFERTGSIPS